MHIETSAGARQSRQRTAGGSHDGTAASGRGIFATIASSAFSSVVGGASRSSASTADTDSGAGLRGSIEDCERPSRGDAISAPSKGDQTPSPSNPMLPSARSWVCNRAERAQAYSTTIRACTCSSLYTQWILQADLLRLRAVVLQLWHACAPLAMACM